MRSTREESQSKSKLNTTVSSKLDLLTQILLVVEIQPHGKLIVNQVEIESALYYYESSTNKVTYF